MKDTVKAENRIVMIPVFLISSAAVGCERGYSRENLSALSKRIEKNGILQPITVRDVANNEFELVSGERRLRAAVMAGLTKVPCIILHCTKRQSAVYSLVENIQREGPDIFERAESIRALTEYYGFSKEQVSTQLGMPQKTVNENLAILAFSKKERGVILSERLTFRQAAELIKITDSRKRKNAITKAVKGELSENETAQLVESILSPKASPKAHKIIFKDLRLFSNTIEHAVSTMKSSGISSELTRTEDDSFIEFRIRIAKH